MSEPVMTIKAEVVDVHFDRADRGKDGYSVGHSATGVAKIADENGKSFEVGVCSGQEQSGITPFLKDGYLTNAGLAAAGYEIDQLADFR